MTQKQTHFPLPLHGKFLGNECWQLTSQFVFLDGSFEVVVPPNFITDGASIPQFAHSLIGGHWSGRYPEAAVIHDYLYSVQATSRWIADRTFLRGMKILGTPFWKRQTMFWAVRTFSWLCWNKRRNRNG